MLICGHCRGGSAVTNPHWPKVDAMNTSGDELDHALLTVLYNQQS
jgi:hypothetical protein